MYHVDAVIKGLCSLGILMVDPPCGKTEDRRENNQTDNVGRIYHGLYDVAGDQVHQGGCHRSHCLRLAVACAKGGACANLEKHTDHNAYGCRDGNHHHGNNDGGLHQLAHAGALLHVDDHLHDGYHNQRHNQHLDEVDEAVTDHAVPGGNFFDKGYLGRVVREACDGLHHKTQSQSQHGSYKYHDGEIDLLFDVHVVDQDKKRNQRDQEYDGLNVADHEELL